MNALLFFRYYIMIRWSQIMYMYYFLGFQVSGEHGNRQIVEDEKSVKCREAERKDRIKRYKDGQNIFLLGKFYEM